MSKNDVDRKVVLGMEIGLHDMRCWGFHLFA